MENSGFSQAFVARTEISSERYSLTNRLAEKMTAPVEGMRSDSDASLRSVRIRHHFDVRIAVLSRDVPVGDGGADRAEINRPVRALAAPDTKTRGG
jgi:hypothetical protein